MTSSSLARGTRPPAHEDPRWLRLIAVPAMLSIGALVAVQAQLHGDLAGRLGGGVAAGVTVALISFGSGLVLLCGAALVSAPMRAGLRSVRAALWAGRLRPWHVVGGLAGAFLVLTQGLTVGTIGVALFTVAVVGGQTTSSLAVDHVGAGPRGARPVSATRVAGALLTVAAVAVAASERVGGPDALSAAAVALALLPLAAGAAIAWQQAVNGQVSLTGGPWAATWVNFAAGSTALLVATGVMLLVAGPSGALPTAPEGWWLYLGGPIGVVFISAAAVLVRVHGVLVLGLCTVCGQVAAALVIDELAGTGALGARTVSGATLALVGALLVWSTALDRPRRRRGDGQAISDMRYRGEP